MQSLVSQTAVPSVCQDVSLTENLSYFPPTGEKKKREPGNSREQKHTVVGQRSFWSDEWTNKYLPGIWASLSSTLFYFSLLDIVCTSNLTMAGIYLEQFHVGYSRWATYVIPLQFHAMCFTLTEKLSPCCFYFALWLHFLPTQTRTSSVPLYAHLMYLWGFRFDMLRTVWVSVYSSYRLFVACFSLDTVLQQLICHDMFLLCLSNSTCCQIQPVVKKLWERVPSVENAVPFFIYLNLFMQFIDVQEVKV